MTATWQGRFGDYDLSPQSQSGDVERRVYGIRRGSSGPVVTTVESMLQDGALEIVDHWDNRDQQLLIGLKGPDSGALAAEEALLFAEVRKGRNELSWIPPDGYGAETVFDVLWSTLDFSEDGDWDLDELRGHRVYVLTLRSHAWGRSATETTVPALTSSAVPSTTVISDGTSATGWSTPDGSITVTSGQLVVPKASSPTTTYTDSYGNTIRRYAWEATRTLSAVDFSATPYLTLEVDVSSKSTQFQITPPQVFVDGLEVSLVAVKYLPPAVSGWSASPLQCTYLALDPSASSVRIVGMTETVNSTLGDVLLDNVSRSNVAPAVSTTGRESLRTLEIGGAARTPVSLKVNHATAALGTTMVYTCPTLSAVGYSPAILQYRSSVGSGTADTATLSGTRFDSSSSGQVPQFEVPAALLPKGGYLLFLVARSKSGSITERFSWTASTKVGSTQLGQQSGTSDLVSLDAGSAGWKFVPIGGMVLPPTDVSESSSATVSITISGGTTWEWTEALLCYMGDDAALTVVDAGRGSPAIGTSHNTLWVESPTLDSPAPRVMLGLNGAHESAFHAGDLASSWYDHKLVPGSATVFVANLGAANPEVSGRYYKRWPTHAAE